jgi:predicted RNase H-like HicB family nuclease
MSHYVALVHKDADSDFGVSFPDFPGCITAGRTIDEALEMAQEALALHLKGMVEDGEVIPAPSSAGQVWNDRDNRDGVFAFVKAVLPADKAVRVQISLERDDLAAIDRYVEENGFTRSNFLIGAAKALMRRAEQ